MNHILYLVALLSVLIPSTGAAVDSIVATRTDDVSSESVRTAVETVFAQRFPDLAPGLEVRVVRMGNSVESASALRVRFNHSDAIPRGHAQVRLLTLNEGSWSDAGWALLYVAHFDSVAISRSDVPKGGSVAPGDVTFAWIETTKFRGQPLRPDDWRAFGSDGLYAYRPLRSGEAIRADDLRPPYVAETGQTITVTYRRSGLDLKVRCQAREPGHLGDVIRAYSPDTKSTYKVVLTGPGSGTWKSTL